MIRLNLGCGITAKPGFINVDKYYTEKDLRYRKGVFRDSNFKKSDKYVQADILSLPFPDNYADYIECFDCIEHFSLRETIPALKEMRRVLKVGSTLILTTCDFTSLALDWIKMMVAGAELFNFGRYISQVEAIYGNQRADGEYHKVPMTPQYLHYVIRQAGFSSTIITGYEKNSPVPRIGTVIPKPGMMLRVDQLVVDTVK